MAITFRQWCEKNNPLLLDEWYYDRNLPLTPGNTTSGSGRKVWWLGSCGHDWEALISNRIKGKGCPYCAIPPRAIKIGFNDLETTNPELAKEWHPVKNGLLNPTTVTKLSNKKVWWLGSCGHEWEATVSNRTYGKGCPYCVNKKAIKGFNDLATTNPELAKEWHPVKNGLLKPTDFTAGSSKIVWWKCSRNHEWKAAIYSRSQGNCCPECTQYLHTSFPEKAIAYYFAQYTVVKENWIIKNTKMELDVYLPEYKIGIEYDGLAWHDDLLRDLKKNSICIDNGIKLIRIREKGLPEIDQCTVIWVRKNNSLDLDKAIEQALDYIGIRPDNMPIRTEQDYSVIKKKVGVDYEKSVSVLHPELLSEWNYEKNQPLEPKDVTIGSHRVVWWIGECGHEYQLEIRQKVKGRICPICKEMNMMVGEGAFVHDSNRKKKYSEPVPESSQTLAVVAPDLIREWDSTKNVKHTPDKVRFDSRYIVWWKDNYGHEWRATIKSRYNGGGCPICNSIKKQKKCLSIANPDLAKEWHPTKNDSLKPSDVTANSGRKVWWLGPCGHEWDAVIRDRNEGCGCPYCSGKRVLVGYNDLSTTNSRLIEEWNYEKNQSIKPTEVSAGSMKKVWWICKNGHEWQSTISDRSRGRGCPYCARIRRSK